MSFLPVEKAISDSNQRHLPDLKKWLGQLLKFALAAAVVAYLIFHGDIAWEPIRSSLHEWRYSLTAFLILAATPAGHFYRWQSLLRAGGVFLPNGEVFSYLMVSKFFNMAFPGYVSGDVLRGYYVFRRTTSEPESAADQAGRNWKAVPPTVVASIIFDRVAGLLPLIIFCLVGLLGSLWYPLPSRFMLAGALVAGTCVAVIGILFWMAYRLAELPAVLLWIGRRLHCEESLRFLHEVTHFYVRNLRLMGKILGLSFLTQGASLLSFILLGAALKVQIPLVAYFMFVPLGLMLTAIPVTPAGLGVGQVAFLSLFHIVGTAHGANLYTLYAASYVLINLCGAVFYVSARIPSFLPHSPNPAKIEKE